MKNSMKCPLCGRKGNHDGWNSRLPKNRIEIENQIANFDRALESFGPRNESILVFIENREMMCPLCHEIMNGIEDEKDRAKLEARINEQVEKLEEKMEDMLVGKL